MEKIAYVGIDYHQNTLSIAVRVEGKNKIHESVRIKNEDKIIRMYLKKLSEKFDIRACYEASCSGYYFQRKMKPWGYPCEVIAPCSLPKKRGDRRKNDFRDAINLAHLDYLQTRIKYLDHQIEQIAGSEMYGPAVKKPRAFRGIKTLSAMLFITEITDFRLSYQMKADLAQVDPHSAAIAVKCLKRLHKRYWALTMKGKIRPVALTAIARELLALFGP